AIPATSRIQTSISGKWCGISRCCPRTEILKAMNFDQLRADVVGSLLRPAVWREARAAFDEGRVDEPAFRRIEDDAVRDAIRFQEALGFEVVTDGEIRRLNFQDSFGGAVSGFAAAPTTLRGTHARVAGGKAMARFDMPDLHQHGPAVTRRRPAVT